MLAGKHDVCIRPKCQMRGANSGSIYGFNSSR
jgi:hypothetical protein